MHYKVPKSNNKYIELLGMFGMGMDMGLGMDLGMDMGMDMGMGMGMGMGRTEEIIVNDGYGMGGTTII